MMRSWKWLAFVFLILTNVALVKSQFPTQIFFFRRCLNNGNYTRNSTYKANLDTLLSSVSSNIDSNGFYNASMGENSDIVNLIALCRADLQPSQCRDYVANATVMILRFCPNQKQAVLWHEFCMVRFSNETIYETAAYLPVAAAISGEEVPNQEKFNQELYTLLDSLHIRAANSSSPQKFAAASRAYPEYRTIYAFEQCTPDISPENCNDCLRLSALYIQQCCFGATGARILRPSCYLRIETGPFYNETMVRSLELVPTPQPIPAPPGNSDKTTRTIIIVIVPIVVCLLLVICISIFLRMRRMHNPVEKLESQDDNEISIIESLQYDFGMIRAVTNDFSDANKLGQGGFGAVYKGKLPNGKEVAVKRLSRDSGQGDAEFKNEVLLVARLQHRNLIRLLGFALEGIERLLIYEWVENGSLDHIIFDPVKRQNLDWESRFKIIRGVARGLLYLHEDSRLQIIHRDLKAGNVLLDGEMNSKISDFGMARLFVPDETQGSTKKIVGTYGYMAPEYAIHGRFSTKSDVFSFGVLVLEIVTGQKANNFQNGENEEYLLTYAWKNWHEGTIEDMLDPALRVSSGSLNEIMRCIHIGLLCVQQNSDDRPTMASVVLMLTSFSITMSIPSLPAFFMSGYSNPEISHHQDANIRASNATTSSEGKSSNSTHSSANVTISELYPR